MKTAKRKLREEYQLLINRYAQTRDTYERMKIIKEIEKFEKETGYDGMKHQQVKLG